MNGKVIFKNIIEGYTFVEKLDESTGFSHKIIIDNKKIKVKPYVLIEKYSNFFKNKKRTIYTIPSGAILIVNDGDFVNKGEIIAKTQKEAIKTRDITGGLPKIVELFEARSPINSAILSECNGFAFIKDEKKDKRKIILHSKKNIFKQYNISKEKTICIKNGDFVRMGENLIDGPLNPHDILNILGEKYLSKYLISEIQNVYKLQGVYVNDKHIEIILKQMLKRVIIKEPGDTSFLIDEQIEKRIFHNENSKICVSGGKKAISIPLLLGITEASLATESFISSASFQETTRVLTDSAILNKIDYLRGLKENVIMGRLIPAGTGFIKYRKVFQENIIKISAKKQTVEINIPKNIFEIP